jgi:hypothetical protein
MRGGGKRRTLIMKRRNFLAKKPLASIKTN